MMETYVERVRAALLAGTDEGMAEPSEERLLDLYTLLVLVKGEAVTLADVHDAWAVARQRERPTHPDLVPFRHLPEAVTAYDEPFAAAIAGAAARTEGLR